MAGSSLPTKKQRLLLEYITEFIATYGYSPSYREIRAGMSYSSIATVAKHVDNLVAKGLLTKRPGSARSLEPTSSPSNQTPAQLKPKQSEGERWLLERIDTRLKVLESRGHASQAEMDSMQILVSSLKILGLDAAYATFASRLKKLVL